MYGSFKYIFVIPTFMYFADLGNSVTALCLLCYLLPDSRSKPDHKKIIIFCDVRKTDNVHINYYLTQCIVLHTGY